MPPMMGRTPQQQNKVIPLETDKKPRKNKWSGVWKIDLSQIRLRLWKIDLSQIRLRLCICNTGFFLNQRRGKIYELKNFSHGLLGIFKKRIKKSE